jgi:hypothetical protein
MANVHFRKPLLRYCLSPPSNTINYRGIANILFLIVAALLGKLLRKLPVNQFINVDESELVRWGQTGC